MRTSSQPAASGRRPKRRLLRGVAIAALVLVAAIASLSAFNLMAEQRERSAIAPYGERVPVAGGSMNVWETGRRPGRATIVLISGLGTPAPALDFAPLVRELDGANIVVVEGFGYGYSDMKARPRTVDNITAELHDVLGQLGVRKPYALVGHSISGFYTLAYANRYPEEVSAVIGIDPTVPAAKADAGEPARAGINWGRVLAATGLVRAAISLAPSLATPAGDAFTEGELAQMRRMTIWNFSNSALVDETTRIASNASALRGVNYPDDMPVLTFLATESIDTIPGWVKQHEELLSSVTRQEVVVLDGGHYLHWTQSPALAQKIGEFLGEN